MLLKEHKLIHKHPEIMCSICNYETVSERVTERVLREDKNHSTGLKMSDPQIMVPNEPLRS